MLEPSSSGPAAVVGCFSMVLIYRLPSVPHGRRSRQAKLEHAKAEIDATFTQEEA